MRGGYVNNFPCAPLDFGPTDDPDVFRIECIAGSAWNGDWTGHTKIHFKGTVATDGSSFGRFEETFIGTYAGDDSVGALFTKGYFAIDANGAFIARAQIVGGACDWAGSRGSVDYDGYQVNGGYVGEWLRPASPRAGPCDLTKLL